MILERLDHQDQQVQLEVLVQVVQVDLQGKLMQVLVLVDHLVVLDLVDHQDHQLLQVHLVQ